MDEFDRDMQLMFDQWLIDNGKDHKYFKTYQAIQERFRKAIAKAHQKVNETENKLKSDAETNSQ
jgi:hypothetical protein